MHRRARDGGMGYLPQEASVFRKLTVEQNLLAPMELLGIPRRERRLRCQELLEQFELTGVRRQPAAKLSGGERRRLEVARCLISHPVVILMDEPFANIDPITVQKMQQLIRQLKQRGISILITDHAAREILQIVDRGYVIHNGKVLCEGTPEQIRQHPEVRQIYLGNWEDETSASADSDGSKPEAFPVPAAVPSRRFAVRD
jgi:lipopolysaccharide export system ATP-binding protein